MEWYPALESRSIAGLAPATSVKHELVVVDEPLPLPILQTITFSQLLILLNGWMIGLFALGADPFAQSLGEHSQHRIGEVEGIAAQIQQTNHRLDRTVGVEGTEHQVACERGFNGDIGRFFVPHLPDHDDIRVSTQERPHRGRERKADLRMDLDLAETILGNFNGVFGRPNLPLIGIDVLEDRVPCRRFSGSSWSDTQNDPVWFLCDGLNSLQGGGSKLHRVE